MAKIRVPSSPNSQVPAASKAVLDSFHSENRASATRLRACHRLFVLCQDEQFEQMLAAGFDPECDDRRDYAVVDPFDIAASEIVAAYGVHTHRARAILRAAIGLVEDFPYVLSAMESGRIDERLATMLIDQMRTVDAARRDAVQKDVIDWLLGAIEAGRRPGREAILNETDRLIRKHDPDGVLFRRREALKNRHVHIRRSRDGMSIIKANLPSPEASSVFDALTDAAREQIRMERAAKKDAADHASGEQIGYSDRRTMDQRRADALVDVILGGTEPQAGPKTEAGSETAPGREPETETGAGAAPETEDGPEDDGPSSGDRRTPLLRPHITVLTSLGPHGEPEVYLPRGGAASIEALIALLARSVGATISLPNTEPGAADSPQSARRYRISAELARRIRLRDGTCRHPGCSVPAEDCDVDHVRPYSHTDPTLGGLTIEQNLMCLCRRHHRFKTFFNWQYRLARDGTLTVITSTGRKLSTEPAGPMALWRRHVAKAAGPPDDPADAPPNESPDESHDAQSSHGGSPRSWLDPEPQPTQWRKRAQHLVAERQANYVARHTPRVEEPPPF